MDSGKKMIFTNNIPKAGFLIDPVDPVSRRRRQVRLTHGPPPGGGRGQHQGWGMVFSHVLGSGLGWVPSWMPLPLLLVPRY